MKKLIYLFLFSIFNFGFAQILPKVSYEDFGCSKPIAKMEIVYYSFKDKFVLDIRKEIYHFNKEGKLEKIEKEDYDNYSKSEINYFYKNGLLTKETLINKKNPTENYEMIFEYNKDNKVIATAYKSQEYNETYRYKYQGKNLVKAIGESDGEKFEENYLYDKNNNLYQLKRTDFSSKQKYNTTVLYLKGVEIGGYSQNYDYPYFVFKNEKAEINFGIISEKGIEKLKNLENELASGNDLEREDLNNQIYQLADKKVDAEFSYGNFNLIKDGSIVANADLEKSGKDPEFLNFRKIYFADGTEVGTSDFDIFVYNEIKHILKN
ncbi:hypothetical protein SAMN05421847_2657 [Halpernia humi]|uniref:Uncharacterized protein n=1 Tax=Halpernia humi TaxID=493375 RepID=A0A1H6B1R8_9FLAO|nr:hypothetical protein [Halpernia humi]SEG54749.1 hypothetical protein SAMN05421847_2657 [Halpernia humi]